MPPRGRPSASSASSARVRPSAATQAPVYQPPENPLTPSAQNALNSLKRTHQLTGVEKHLKEANIFLGDCVYDANNMLAEREANVEKRRVRAEREGVELDAQEQLDLEERRRVVEKLNSDIDQRTRKTIDEQYAVQYMRDALEAATISASNAATLAVSQAMSFDPTMPDAPSQPDRGPPPSDLFKRNTQAKIDGWQQMTLATRYAQHPDYINFKTQLHTGAHGDDVVMQPASRWFAPARGSPAPGTVRGHGADDSDDDIVIARETVSTKCPVTLTELVDPIMSKLCRHTFEKAAIMQMIGHRSDIECPSTGCNKVSLCCVAEFGKLTSNSCIQRISKASLHVDQVILKKIKRIQQSKIASQHTRDDSDDDDLPADGRNANKSILLDDASGDDDFDTLIDDERVSSTPKIEPQSSRPPASSRANQVVDMEDEDDESEEGDEDATMEDG
jgi:hypothetical protein